MIDSKILITLAGLLASVYAVNLVQNKKDDVVENFWGNLPSFDIKVDQQVAPNAQAAREGKFTSIQNNYRSMLNPKEKFYTVPGTFQSQLAPRFFGGDYGANITYNLPSKDNLAVPSSPLDYANSVVTSEPIKENFCASGDCGGPVSCGAGGQQLSYHGGAPLMEPNYSSGNYQDTMNKLYSGDDGKAPILRATHSNLPVGDMTTLNSVGQTEQPIVFDRYMYANRNSKLRKGGDPIRGDLAIAPNNNGWFNVSVQPNVDLQQGAMNVMGGINNESAQELADLIYTTSGKAKTTIGGMNMARQLGNPTQTKYFNSRYRTGLNDTMMGNQYQTNLSAGNSDVNVAAYP